MNFEESMKISFLDNNPGNVSAYIKLHECISKTKKWKEEDWINARTLYYRKVSNPGSAWLHDIYKNRCFYDINKAYNFIFYDLRR